MTPNEAVVLAEKLRNSWPQSKISLDVWAEELASLDAGRAGTALARLRRESEHSPSIARFIMEYRAVETHQHHRDPYVHECGDCEDTGFVEVRRPQDSLTAASSVKPCMCKAGQELEPSFGRILAANPPLPRRSAS